MLLIKHIWILLDSYPVKQGAMDMTEEELEAYRWLYGTVVAYGSKSKVMEADYAKVTDK